MAIVLVAKPAVALVFVWALRRPIAVALTVAIALAQIGEFSFILSTIGRELGLLTPVATNTLVAAAIVSIVLNPLLYGAIGPIERWLRAHPTPVGRRQPRAAGAGGGPGTRGPSPSRRAAPRGDRRLRPDRPHRGPR